MNEPPEPANQSLPRADARLAPVVPEYKMRDPNSISSNLAFAYGLAGFFMFYATLGLGILIMKWSSDEYLSIWALPALFLFDVIALALWIVRGRKEPLIGFIVGLAVTPLVGCGLCAALTR